MEDFYTRSRIVQIICCWCTSPSYDRRIFPLNKYFCGPDSSVGIATGYGLDGPWIESRWWRDFPHLSTPALGPTQPPVQWVPGLSRGVKNGRGLTLTPHPLLVPLVMKDYSYTSTPPMGRTACTEPQCLYKGVLYLTSTCAPTATKQVYKTFLYL